MGKFIKRQRTDERRDLLKELKKYQLNSNELALMHSTSAMQTSGLKKFANVESIKAEQYVADPSSARSIVVQLNKKRRRRKRNLNGNTNAYSSSSSSEDTDNISSDTDSDTDCYYQSESELDTKLVTSSETGPKVEKNHQKVDENLNNSEKLHTPQQAGAQQPPKRQTSSESKQSIKSEPAINVPVTRLPEIETARLKLPIINEEQNLIETIRYNDIVVVSGETGSGKTTQLPQFLYEAGYALNGQMIGITEPRRVAAVSMSERVCKELNLTSKEVSYQIRFSGNVLPGSTKIKFMTDGVLLRECQKDLLLSKYSVIIIDEAHERSVFSDILIGLLSRIVPLRAKRNMPLKLIIMSATLRISDFTQNSFLFKLPPPVINIEARQFPVTVQFAKRTPDDYLRAAFKKVCSIHSKMPRGGILVFVTSQMDVKVLCRKLKDQFPTAGKQTNKKHNLIGDRTKPRKDSDEENNSETDFKNFKISKKRSYAKEPTSDLSSNSEDDDEDVFVKTTNNPLHCLGLYAMLPLEKQRLVFREPPEGTRLCVIATNVAETSITIPNIKYVIDTGLEKTKVYDLTTGISKFVTTWTSKSSAEQRMGRAGRMGPGQCHRLYSSAVFTNDFPEHTEPRILQKPVEDVLLQMKSMNIDNVVHFPFPTRPSMEALIAAEKKLITLGALDDSKLKFSVLSDTDKNKYSSRPTPLGKAMARFSVSARCSKMIVQAPQELLPHVISLVSALSVREIFLNQTDCPSLRDIKKKLAGHNGYKLLGDFMTMIRAICFADKFECSPQHCAKFGLRRKAMLEIYKLREQLCHEVNASLKGTRIRSYSKLKRPTEDQCVLLRQLLLSSFCDHVATKITDCEIAERTKDDPNKIEKKKLRRAYECKEHDGPVFISSDSVLKGEHPDYIIYRELYKDDKNKTYMRDVAVINHCWLQK